MAKPHGYGVKLLCLLLLRWGPLLSSATFDITAVLDEFPEFGLFNRRLTETQVADEINALPSATLFAPSDEPLRAAEAANPGLGPAEVANFLRYHVVTQFVTLRDLQALGRSNSSTLSTLLGGENGAVRIFTTVATQKVLIGHSTPDNAPNATAINTAFLQPSELTVILIDRALEPVGFNPAPVAGANITAILTQVEGYRTFARLLGQTGVDRVLESRQTGKGVTVFAPTDEAFERDLPEGSFEGLNPLQQVLLLQYHALGRYRSLGSLWRRPSSLLDTLASPEGRRREAFKVFVIAESGVVTIFSSTPNAPNATVRSTLYDANPLVVYSVDAVLLPIELRAALGDGASPGSSAPAPAPTTGFDVEPVARPPDVESPRPEDGKGPAVPPAVAAATVAGPPAWLHWTAPAVLLMWLVLRV